MSNKYSRFFIVVTLSAAMIFFSSGCRKSKDKVAEQVAIEKHEQELKTNAAVQALMKDTNFAQAVKSMAFLKSLKNSGRLPGVSKDEHGTIRAEKTPTTNATNSYVYSQEFHFITQSSPPNNLYYVVTRSSSNEELHLQKAWRGDASGQVLEEYPLE